MILATTLFAPLLLRVGDPVQPSIVETAHFRISAPGGQSVPNTIVQMAESTYRDVSDFASAHRLSTRPIASRMAVVFFTEWREFEQHAGVHGPDVNEQAPGFFDERSNCCLILDFAGSSLARRKREEIKRARNEVENERDPRMLARRRQGLREAELRLGELERLLTATVVRHELAHQVLFNLGVQPSGSLDRRWLNEGLAMQFETDEPVNRYRVADFLAAIKNGQVLSARQLVGDPALLGPDAPHLQAAYASAWALVYYLLREKPAAFAEYLQAPDRGRQAKAEMCEKLFGPLDSGFDARWRQFVQSAVVTTQPAQK